MCAELRATELHKPLTMLFGMMNPMFTGPSPICFPAG